LTDVVELRKLDEVWLHVQSDRGILREIQDHFSFEIENARFDPRVKARSWDGRIKLLNLQTQTMYVGLLDELIRFCEARDYELRYDYSEFADDEMSLYEGQRFMDSLVERALVENDEFEVRDYQVESFVHCVRKRRALLLSPTSTGKSFVIHALQEYYSLPTLIIVDGTGPVHQMVQDLASFGVDPETMHKLYGGQEKYVDQRIVVSTWQSLLDMPDGFFDRFEVIIGDEAHHFAAKSFTALMEKIPDARYRFGFTGTIKGSKCNTMVLEGLFGKVTQFITTREAMDKGYLANLDIKCIVLQYPDAVKKMLEKSTYDGEKDFLIANEARNRFIRNLAGSVEGNTLVFFNFREHGERLHAMIREAFPEKRVFLIYGGVDGELRNDIRQVFEDNDDCIGVVSYGTFQTAISIKNIFNLIFGFAYKGRIRNLQSIGRGLRKSKRHGKDRVTLYDIADNLMSGGWKNHTIKQFGKRIEIYSEEKFKPKIYNVTLKGG
jgi:superfamily II DNA or RNA helicase